MSRTRKDAAPSPASGPGNEQQRQAPSIAAMFGIRAGHGRRSCTAVLVAMTMFNAACYKLVPLDTTTPVGADVVLVLNDRGRAGLADSVGTAVDEIEGTLRSAGDTVYQLDVRSVRFLRAAEQQWSGERLGIPRTFVTQANERRLDKKRSWLIGIGAAAALVLAIASVKLLGGSSPQGSGNNGPPPVEQ